MNSCEKEFNENYEAIKKWMDENRIEGTENEKGPLSSWIEQTKEEIDSKSLGEERIKLIKAKMAEELGLGVEEIEGKSIKEIKEKVLNFYRENGLHKC